MHPQTDSTMTSSQAAVAQELENIIHKATTVKISVHIDTISGDGNCLFRALANAITRNQTGHDVLRLYITSYMAEPVVTQKLQLLIADAERQAESHIQHVIQMQDAGQWGTEQEIVAAAQLFDCSIVCFSKYSDGQFCIQHFSPHFIHSVNCTASCNHKTIYLINSSGAHYESATVLQLL